jgi:RHS repeat-associated protein
MNTTLRLIPSLAVFALLPLGAFAQQFASYPNTGSWVSAQNADGYPESDDPAIFGFYSGTIPPGTVQYDVAFTIPASVPPGDQNLFIYLQSNSTRITNDTAPGSSVSAYQILVNSAGSVYLEKFVSGTGTQLLGSEGPPITAGSTYHAISNSDGTIQFYVEAPTVPPTQLLLFSYTDSSPLVGGAPGFSLAAAQSDQSALFDCTPTFVLTEIAAPPTGAQFTMETYSLPTRVDLHAAGISGGANEEPIASYSWYRAGTLLATTAGPDFSDVTVVASTSYSYSMIATTFGAYTLSTVTASVTTPPTGSVSNNLIGVRATGSYWGGMGEQIDVRSGNLNFSYPLVTAVTRGLSVPIALSYNSQNWREDSNGAIWNLAEATPGGFGWNLQVGSLQTYYSNAVTVNHYEFTDASGAIYHLTQNNSGIWSSVESAYVWYDSNPYDVCAGCLYFRNGTFWTMGSVSAGTESDAGTMYPTMVEDSNGNQVAIQYDSAIGFAYGPNTSGRIVSVSDARAGSSPTYALTYTTTTATAGVKVAATLTNSISSGESFTFAAATNQTLYPPWGSAQMGTANLLTSVTNSATSLTTSFTYNTNSAGGSSAYTGELAQVTFPYGGFISWQYGNQTLASLQTLREVTQRGIEWDEWGSVTDAPPAIGQRTYILTRDSGDGSRFVPLDRTITDNIRTAGNKTAYATKVWTFSQGTNFTEGLVTSYSEQQTSPSLQMRLTSYTWAQDPVSNPYVGQVQTTSDPGQTYAVTAQVAQTLDQYGNVTQSNLYNFNSLTTPAKTYTNTYLNSSAYLSAYIFNRLLTSTVTNGTTNLTLVTNTYDNYTGNYALQGGGYTGLTAFDQNDGVYDTTRGNVTTSVSFTKTLNYTYDITGTVLEEDDGHSHKVNITTASTTNYSVPAQIQTNGGTLTTSINWSGFLAPTMVQNPTGAQATTIYNSTTARPTSTTSPYGATTSYTYANTGPQVTATIDGRWTSTYYDGLGRPYRTAVGVVGSAATSFTDTVYDACGCTPLGKPWQTSTPYAPTPTPTGVWTVNTYDALGRTVSTVAPDTASTTTYQYQGNVATVTDPAGKYKIYTVDAFNELIAVGETDPTGNVSTAYTYDLLGHLTQVSMPRTVSGNPVTQTRSWVYSSTTELLTSKTMPESGTVSYTYNTDTTLATVVDANNHEKKFTYDTYGRVTQVARGTLSGTTFTEDTTQRSNYTYDSSHTTNCGSLTNTMGHVAEIDYQVVEGRYAFAECYNYNTEGAVTKKTLTSSTSGAPPAMTATYSYDTEGRVSGLVYPGSGGPTLAYGFDTLGRPYSVTGGATTVSAATYGPANQMLTLTTSAFSETRTYNANLQLTGLVSGGYSFQYNYSATQNNGRIQSMTDSISGETITYQYDSLNRMINASGTGDANGAWSQAFTYDGFGNLVAKAGTNAPNNITINVNPANNQLTGNNALFDSVGNLLQYGVGTPEQYYTYDIENRVAQLTASSVVTMYGYDTRNQRVYAGPQYLEDCGGSEPSERFFFYGIDGKKLAVFTGCSGSVSVTQTNIWFAGRLLKAQDRLKSIGKYFPYGEDRTNPSPANPANGQEKFATYTRDAESGLDYAYQRYYTSGLGRMLTPDPYDGSAAPAGPQSWNGYAYVEGDPAGFNDPEGLYLRAPDSPPTDPWGCPPSSDVRLRLMSCISFGGFGGDGGGNGGGGGGGGIGWSPKIDIATNSVERGVLSARLTNFASSNCAKVIGAVFTKVTGTAFSVSQFVAVANSIDFYNATNQTVGAWTQNQVSGNGNSGTLSAAAGGNTAVTIINGIQPAIILGASFFQYQRNQTFAGNTLLHELLHAFTGWSDAQVYQYFAAYGLTQYGSVNTESISAWLSTDCKSTPLYLNWLQTSGQMQ